MGISSAHLQSQMIFRRGVKMSLKIVGIMVWRVASAAGHRIGTTYQSATTLRPPRRQSQTAPLKVGVLETNQMK
jgi:hypothetical protein